MAFYMKAGRGPMMKTGKGIPQTFQSPDNQSEAMLQQKIDPKDGEFKKELETVRSRAKEGGFINTVKNIGTGLSHGYNSQGYDSKPSGAGVFKDKGGNKDLAASVGSAISTAYKYAKGDVPKKVTEKNKPKKVKASQKTYLD